MNDGQLNRICHVTQCDGITQAGTDNCGISHLSLVSIQTQPIAFLAVFVYATHTTQAIAFEWKSGFICMCTCTTDGARTSHRVRCPL